MVARARQPPADGRRPRERIDKRALKKKAPPEGSPPGPPSGPPGGTDGFAPPPNDSVGYLIKEPRISSYPNKQWDISIASNRTWARGKKIYLCQTNSGIPYPGVPGRAPPRATSWVIRFEATYLECQELGRGDEFDQTFDHHRVSRELLNRMYPLPQYAGRQLFAWKFTDITPVAPRLLLAPVNGAVKSFNFAMALAVPM